MRKFRGNSTSKRILDVLKSLYLGIWKTKVKFVTIVEFRVSGAGDDSTGCFEIKITTDTAKFTDMRTVRSRWIRNLISKSKVLIKDQDCDRVSGIEWETAYLASYLSPIAVLEKLRVNRLAVIQEDICSSVLWASYAWIKGTQMKREEKVGLLCYRFT